jgi:hypothetical protein
MRICVQSLCIFGTVHDRLGELAYGELFTGLPAASFSVFLLHVVSLSVDWDIILKGAGYGTKHA